MRNPATVVWFGDVAERTSFAGSQPGARLDDPNSNTLASAQGDSGKSSAETSCSNCSEAHRPTPATWTPSRCAVRGISLPVACPRLRRGLPAAAPRATLFGQFHFPRWQRGPDDPANLARSRNSGSSSLTFLDRFLFSAKVRQLGLHSQPLHDRRDRRESKQFCARRSTYSRGRVHRSGTDCGTRGTMTTRATVLTQTMGLTPIASMTVFPKRYGAPRSRGTCSRGRYITRPWFRLLMR